MSWFSEAASSINIAVGDAQRPGLRPAQIGAAWALSASFLSGRPTSAMAVLPTGAGKSTVLALVPLLVPPPGPVLVAVPNALIRDQMAEALESQAVLRQAGVLPADVASPTVRVATHRLSTQDAWLDVANGADFVVGTVSVLSPSHKDVCEPPRGLFGMLLVDEAHHVPAPTWLSLATSFPRVHKGLVTATPVRSDGQPIPAELVFTYSLSDAMRDGVVAPVIFVPVVLQHGEDQDRALANKAARRLEDPEHVAGRSLLIVRAGGVAEAHELVGVYAEAGISLGLVTGNTTRREYKKVITDLDDGGLQGVVSVGVLGEGFDYPRIKIAVYHRKHQSLAPTLQFIGRIRRVAGGLGPAELLAIPGNDISSETRELYESDSDWVRILTGLADASVDQERERRRFLGSLRDRRETPLLPEPLSAAALRPAKDVLVFRLPILKQAGAAHNLGRLAFFKFRGEVVLDRVTPDGGMRVVVTSRRSRMPWISSDALDGELFELYVAVIDPNERLIYIHAPTDSAAKQFTERLGLEGLEPEETSWISRFLHGLEVISYFSVGMRATRLPGGTLATYRTLAGNSVAKAVSSSDSIAYAAGHLILQAKNPFGDGAQSSAVGVSMGRAKVWHAGRTDLDGFRRWCVKVGHLGRSPMSGTFEAPGLGLRIPQTLTAFPEMPLAALIDSRVIATGATVRLGDAVGPIAELELIPSRRSAAEIQIVGVLGDAQVLRASLSLQGVLQSLPADPGAMCLLEGARDAVPLLEVLEEKARLTVYYADASSSSGGKLYTAPIEHMTFPVERLLAADWDGVDTRRESKPGRNGELNVQEAMVIWHGSRSEGNEVVWVLNDDGAGEIADLLVIRIPESYFLFDGSLARPLGNSRKVSLRVTLCHCKWAGSESARRDLSDLDQLVGQAHRSLRWLANPTVFWRTVAERIKNRIKVVRGARSDVEEALAMFAISAPAVNFAVQIVQPGLDTEQVAGWGAGETLLSFLNEAVASSGADFSVVGS